MFRNVFSNYLTLIKVHSYNYKLLKIMLLCFQLCEVNASYDNFLSQFLHKFQRGNKILRGFSRGYLFFRRI